MLILKATPTNCEQSGELCKLDSVNADEDLSLTQTKPGAHSQ